MEDLELLNELVAQNPWWKDATIKIPQKIIERSLFPLLTKELKEKEVVCLVGLRSVGKTTVMKMLIHNLLLSKTEAKNILYFSFDGLKKEQTIIKRLITLYTQNVLKLTLEESKEKIYLFFDEVQKISDWGEEIKSYYDKNLKLKFFVSGSSSMNILKGSGESLVGRIIIHKLFPFTFVEFLKYQNVNVEKSDFWSPSYPINSEKITILFQDYLKEGGFPSLYSTFQDRRKQLLKSMVDLTFYRDIVNIFDIKRTDVLEGLFYIFTKESGNVINYSSLSNSLDTKFETINSYIEYLNSAFLISKSSFYSGSKVKSLEKNEKIYVTDHSFNLLQETKEGNKVETVIYNDLKKSGADIFYYQDKNKNEVDIVFFDKSPIAIEVKYQSKIIDSDLTGLFSFLEKYNLKRGIVITKNSFEIKKQNGAEIHYIPAWLFLLSL